MRKSIIEGVDPFVTVEKVPLLTADGKQSSRYAVMLQPEGQEPIEAGVVSEDYKLIKNLEVVEIAEEILQSTNREWHYQNMLFDGRRFRQRWRMDDMLIEPVKGDYIALLIDAYNSYDGTTTFGLQFNALRLICLNGMTTTNLLGGFRFMHYDNPERFEQELGTARSKILGMAPHLAQLNVGMQRMIETPVDVKEIQKFFKDTELPRQYIPEVIQAIEEETQWGLYNAATKTLTEANSFAAENWNGRVSDYMFSRFGVTQPAVRRN